MSPTAIEKRVAELEKSVAELRTKVEAAESTQPWWERVVGTFEKDSIYNAAMRLGRDYRKSLAPPRQPRKR